MVASAASVVGAFDVVTFGETMGSIRASGLLRHGGAMSMSIGGAESNVAIGLARLGHRVRWGGRVGADDVGSLVLRTLRAEGIDAATATIDDSRSTGLLLIEQRIADLSRVAHYRAGSAGSVVTMADVRDSFDASTRVLHLTGITPALSADAAAATLWAARRARELGVRVSFDVNYRGGLWGRNEASAVLTELASFADVIFASEDELAMVAPDPSGSEQTIAESLIAAGASEVVVTRGGDGSSAWTSMGHAECPAHVVPVVDTIGAGDAFTAGYLSALLDELPVDRRLERGTTLGAFAVSASGDWESLPRRDELGLLGHVAGTTIR